MRGQREANGSRDKKGLDHTISDRHDKKLSRAMGRLGVTKVRGRRGEVGVEVRAVRKDTHVL